MRKHCYLWKGVFLCWGLVTEKEGGLPAGQRSQGGMLEEEKNTIKKPTQFFHQHILAESGDNFVRSRQWEYAPDTSVRCKSQSTDELPAQDNWEDHKDGSSQQKEAFQDSWDHWATEDNCLGLGKWHTLGWWHHGWEEAWRRRRRRVMGYTQTPCLSYSAEGGELARGLLLLLGDKYVPTALYLPPTGRRLFKACTITKACKWEKGCIQP